MPSRSVKESCRGKISEISIAWLSSHRGNIAQVDRQRFTPNLLGRCRLKGKVNPLNLAITRQEQQVGSWQVKNRAVIAHPQRHNGPRCQLPGQARNQLKFSRRLHPSSYLVSSSSASI